MVLTGSSMGLAVKFGINTTVVVLEMANFTWLCIVKFFPISNTTLVVFIPNFTATHAITSTNNTSVVLEEWYLSQISLLYPCYSQLIPYSLHICMLCINVAMYTICHCIKHASTLIGAILVLVIAWVAVKFGINITIVVLEMGINFTRRSRVKFTISNTTKVVFIPNFTATHAIPS